MRGVYYPEGDPDAWNPINLTTPLKVIEPSIAPRTAPGAVASDVSSVGGGQLAVSQTASSEPTPWWLSPMGLVLLSIGAIVVVVFILRPIINIG